MTKITRIGEFYNSWGDWYIMSFISVNSFLRESFNLVQRGSWRVYTRFELRQNFITLSRSRTGSRAGSRAGLRSASEQVCDCDQLASWSQTWFPTCCRQVRAVSTCRDSSNLVADRFAAGVRPARELVRELDSIIEFGL